MFSNRFSLWGFILGFIISGAGFSVSYCPASDTLTYESCINQTTDDKQCKDCCDCLTDPSERKECRDECVIHDYTENSDFISVEPASALGPEGDYAAALAAGNEIDCKSYCDESADLECGDRRYCRDACNAAFSGSDQPETNPDAGEGSENPVTSGASISQAISDDAQLKTISFSALAFLTGDLCSYTFFPPGKVSDFFGFQYMRDTAANGFGHNTEFAGRIADNVLSILTDDQVQTLVGLANSQGDKVNAYGYKRFVLIKAFSRLLSNDLPEGAADLDKTAVETFTGDLYEIDGEISYQRAEVLGRIVAEFTDDQKKQMAELQETLNNLFLKAGEGGSIANEEWPAAEPVDVSALNSKEAKVLVSTYATQLYSWYLGSVEGDAYFCPERHGTYFGSFYMKDIPPLTASEPVTIDSNLTAEMGESFLAALDSTQASLITDLTDIQKEDIEGIVNTRRDISEALRPFMNGESVDQESVKAMTRLYGELEGNMMYYYAKNFAAVGNSLTNEQAETIKKLRLDYYAEFPDYQADSSAYDCTGAWLYSDPLSEMPEIENTDFLFAVNGSDATDASPSLLADGFAFAEGPAADADGNVYFSDITNNRIYRWTTNNVLEVFKENTNGINGLFFNSTGDLLACEGGGGRLVSLDKSAAVTVLADSYNKKPFNEPNDLWVAPDGGVYFTDPLYFKSSLSQDGEHVYYLAPGQNEAVRVIDDMIRPNGLVGSNDGKTLYVTDHGAGETYRYTVHDDGTLSDKTLFASVGGDGMTIDGSGNVYICADEVLVYDSDGKKVKSISVPDKPTNACFGGKNGGTLFITTKKALYSIVMNNAGETDGVPEPIIRVNDIAGSVTVSANAPITVDISLNTGGYDDSDADFWICIDTPFGWFFLESLYPEPVWKAGAPYAVQGQLKEMQSYEILKLNGLPTGEYTFYFGIDLNPDGILPDMDKLYYDAAVLEVVMP